MRAQCALIMALATTTACLDQTGEARAQWLVTIHTDAPVPQLGDRLLVELLTKDGEPACSGCQRLFGVRSSAQWPVSFGIPDPGDRALQLRVRLFRSDQSDTGGVPSSGMTLDALGALPPIERGVRPIDVVLYADCAGVASSLVSGTTCAPGASDLVAKTFDALAGEPPRPGSFPLSATTPCAREAEAGMVCVPGGLFVRGSRRILALSLPSTPERLVHVSPFALDATEMTVGAIRTLVQAGEIAKPLARTSDNACTYTDEPGEFEDFPVSCVSREQARRACAARGKRLPTEAEWEYAAGDREAELRYPWGEDTDICRYAVLGRGRILSEQPSSIDLSNVCRPQQNAAPLPWGPRPVGESEDVTTRGLRDLGGNLSEWVEDEPARYDGPCSAGPRVLIDPRCDHADQAGFVVRGGSWADLPLSAESARRTQITASESPLVGFRCAESM